MILMQDTTTENGESIQQGKTTIITQSGPELAQSNDTGPLANVGESKFKSRYWEKRIERRSYDHEGQTKEVAEWSARIMYGGQRRWVNLHTNERQTAAREAARFYTMLAKEGWETALTKFSPDSKATSGNLTFGEYLEAVKITQKLESKTLFNYQNCLRTVCAGVFNLRNNVNKYDYRSGGNAEWIARLDKIQMAKLTAARVEKWMNKFVSDAGKSPTAISSAKRTANSYIRCARSLFSTKKKPGEQSLLDRAMKLLPGKELPSPLPFAGVSLFEAGDSKYKSKINAQTIVAAARNELRTANPEAYKVFLLGLFAGLRRAEIDYLEWRMIDWQQGIIQLYETEFLKLKTDDSAANIGIDPEVLKELKALMPASKSRYVISSERKAKHSLRPYYRADAVFESLTKWLRDKGIKSNKPLHELRKEVGSQIASEQGIYAASAFLRHSDIETTERYYADKSKVKVRPGIGNLLNTEIQVAQPEKASA